MTYRVTISAQADADLRGIYEYIAFKLRSAINAAGQLERLEKAISGLNTMPERYVLYGAGKWTERGLRKMPVDNYLVYYIPDRESLKHRTPRDSPEKGIRKQPQILRRKKVKKVQPG